MSRVSERQSPRYGVGNERRSEESHRDSHPKFALDESLTCGSKSWTDLRWDKEARVNEDPVVTTLSSARTTFHARESNNETRFNKFWTLNNGLGQTYEGWDGQRVHPDKIDAGHRAVILLSKMEVPAFVEEATFNRVLTESLNGFSRHYKGLIGACFGFAMLYACDTIGEAKSSYVAEVANDYLDNVSNLIEYVWRKYERYP